VGDNYLKINKKKNFSKIRKLNLGCPTEVIPRQAGDRPKSQHSLNLIINSGFPKDIRRDQKKIS